MESISIGISSSLTFQNPLKSPKSILHQTLISSPKKTTPLICKLHSIQSPHCSNLTKKPNPFLKIPSFLNHFKPHISLLLIPLTFPISCLATDNIEPIEETSNKINLEAILVSIDEFFNKYPFFVAGVTFIWLVVIPLTEEYLQKYKFISALDAFKKLKDDPNAQLLDIRGEKSLRFLSSPNLRILNKKAIQVEFSEGGEEGFVEKVLERFKEPSVTTLCILDNFDGNSMEVAEILFKNGFKEAYAIRGGVRGKNGWQAIQETLLPPSVHVYPKEKAKVTETNGAVTETNGAVTETNGAVTEKGNNNQNVDNGYVNKSIENTTNLKSAPRSLSPYPNYPDLKPPSSPTPSQP